MKLDTILDPHLPRLAWLAVVDPGHGTTRVLHGAAVEAGEDFLVEGVWEGDFLNGGFASSPHFFGSGLRTTPDGLVVSPSRALVDRVFSCETATGYIIGNSLALLLFATGSTLSPGETYHHATYTILNGIRSYDDRIPACSTDVGPFRQHYFHPFTIDHQGLRRRSAPDPPYFASYQSYVSFLRETLHALLKNSRDPARRTPFVPRLTLSRGYDSPAVAVLASSCSSPPAYTAARSNSLVPGWLSREATLDDGAPIAHELGLRVRRLEPGPPELDERLFLSGGAADPELIFGSLAADAHSDPSPTVLLTGYHGDKVWDRDPGKQYVTPDLRRGDTSGLALSEVRLHAGFVNLAVPFLGARGIESIVEIAKSAEMDPWSVGGSYDRPIPRRIVEEAGVPRTWFGRRKRAVLQTPAVPMTSDLVPAFGRWIVDETGMSLQRYRFLAWAGLGRWAGLRVLEKALAALGIPTTEPSRWPWIPGGDPASLLYRWAISELIAPTGPFPDRVRNMVQSHLNGSFR